MSDLTLPALSRIFVLLTWGFIGWYQSADAQTRSCGTMEYLEDQLDANPNLRYEIQRIERSTQLVAKNIGQDTSTVVIPVVIHVVHHNELQNISEAQIYSQLDVLNEDFQRMNPDRSNTDPQFFGVAGNPHIRFQLADFDPQGRPTTGITRNRTKRTVFYSSSNAVKYSAMGGVDAWPTSDYLNIWVCNLGSGILGYSQFPGGPMETDGVVISYRFFGTTGTIRPPFNQGRTTTHEVGHWLNLRHIWGDGPCGTDDFVDDTPLAERPHHGCIHHAESCGSPDMVQNFMDYTDDACMNLFTRGQANRMRALFASRGARESLLTSPALIRLEPEPVLAFAPPEDLYVNSVGVTDAALSWGEIAGAEFYRVRIRPVGSPRWATRTFVNSYVNTTRLLSCTEYEWQVEGVKEYANTGFSTTQRFETRGCQPVADVLEASETIPWGLEASSVGDQQASLVWQAVPGALRYHLQYKEAGSRRIFSKIVNQPETNLFALQPGTRYLFRVRATFDHGAGPYSPVSSFVPGGQAMLSRMRVSSSQESTYVRAFSNAQAQAITVEYEVWEEAPVLIQVLDRQGRLLKAFDPFLPQPGEAFDLPMTGDLSQASLIQIEDADGFRHQVKVQAW
ncbi:MAG: M43 family zinc metalloprotease [Bacteroidota bacterium]